MNRCSAARSLAAAMVATAFLATFAGSSSAGSVATAKLVCPPVPALATGPAPAQLTVVASRPEPIDQQMLLTGFGAVWSASSSGLVELSTPAASPKILIHQPIDDIALSPSGVFALSRSYSELLQLDPRTLRVTRHWTVGIDSWSIAVSPQAVYIAYATSPVSIDRLDLSTGAITHRVLPNTVDIGAEGRDPTSAIAFGANAVWIPADNKLYRLDPTHLSVLGSPTPVGAAADGVWFGDGSAWTASENPNGGVDRLDATTGCIVARARADAAQIAFAPHAVWLSATAGPMALNSTTAATIAITPRAKVLDGDGAGIAVVGTEVWADYGDIKKIQQIHPDGALTT